jgi:AraC-like DNA-binding protein
MLANKEIIVLAAESRLKSLYREDDSFNFNWHFHREFEITLILNGQGSRLIGENMASYQDLDLVFIPPNMAHSWTSDPSKEKQKALVLQFNRDCFGADFFSSVELSSLSDLLSHAWAYPFAAAEKAKVLMFQIHHSQGVQRMIHFLRLLDLLQSSEGSKISLLTNQSQSDSRVQEQFNLIVDRLVNDKDIKVPQLATELAMSESTFRRFFKKHCGHSVIDFYNELRINKACLLLQNKKHDSITFIAEEAGFNNISHFNRQFKKLKGGKPSDYRKGSNP